MGEHEFPGFGTSDLDLEMISWIYRQKRGRDRQRAEISPLFICIAVALDRGGQLARPGPAHIKLSISSRSSGSIRRSA